MNRLTKIEQSSSIWIAADMRQGESKIEHQNQYHTFNRFFWVFVPDSDPDHAYAFN